MTIGLQVKVTLPSYNYLMRREACNALIYWFTDLEVYGLPLFVQLHIGVDEAEYIIDEVSIYDSVSILDLLSADVVEQIEKHIGENLDQIIENNKQWVF